MVSDADFLKSLQTVTDPIAALRMILDNESFLGFDSYYADLRRGLLDMARRVVDAEPTSDAQRWQAFLAHSFAQPAGTATAYAPPAAAREEHDRIVNDWIDELDGRKKTPATWMCSRCKVDRLKSPCGDPHSGRCPMVATAQNGQKQSNKAGEDTCAS